MATQLLAIGSTSANSPDFIVASGSSVTVALKGAASDAAVGIFLKDDAGGYVYVGSLTPARPAVSITAAGTYRLNRTAGAACGAFSA